MSMLRFYLSLVRDIPSVFRDSYERWTFWILAIAAPVVLLVWPDARPMTDSPWIIAVPVLMSVAYGMLRVNYARFKALEEIIDGLRSELSEAQQRLDTRASLEDRMPYVEIRPLANARGWKLNDDPAECHNTAQCHNRGYDLETAMRQAASDGSLKVWGRKCETPIGSNPLLLIPKEHFLDFEFGHGYLHGGNVKNIWSHTGILGKDRNSFSGRNYCDLHVSKMDITRLLHSVPPSDGVVTDSMD